MPPTAREVFRTNGFYGVELADTFYLTDGSSHFVIEPLNGEATAYLSPEFFNKAAFLRRYFWVLGLLRLLQTVGLYALHAAAVVPSGGEQGYLIVGPSGSGKSTLALGLIRQGWGYLSDDSVVLRQRADSIEALPLRRSFYIKSDAAVEYPTFAFGEETLGLSGARKRQIFLEKTHTDQYISNCIPRVLLFPQVISGTGSTLLQIDRSRALKRLLEQSGPSLDRNAVAQQMGFLAKLVCQVTSYELRAGRDIYHDPEQIMPIRKYIGS